MSYGHVYVARVAIGAKMPRPCRRSRRRRRTGAVADHRLQPLHRARLRHGARRRAAEAGGRFRRLAALPLRPAPGRRAASRRLQLDYGPPKARVADYMRNEARFRMVERTDPERFKEFLRQSQKRRHRALQPVRAARRREGAAGRCGMRMPAPAVSDRHRGVAMDFAPRILDSTLSIRSFLAPRRCPTPSTPSVVSKTPARRRSSCARCSRSRSSGNRWPSMRISTRTPSPLPKRPAISRAPMRSSSVTDQYLEHLRRVKATVHVPVIASLNGTTAGGWLDYARLIEQAGADALELNVYRARHPARRQRAREIERQTIDVVAGREARGPGSDRREAVAELYRAGTYGGADRSGRRGRPGAIQPVLPAGSSTSRSWPLCRPSTCPRPPSYCPGCTGLRSCPDEIQCSLAVTGGVHTAEDIIQGDDGRCARDSDSLGAADERAAVPPHADREPDGVDGEARMGITDGDARQSSVFSRCPTPRPTNARTTCSCCRAGKTWTCPSRDAADLVAACR